MSDPRILGLVLMAVSILAFLGTTAEAMPPVTFFPALMLFAIGAFKFLRTNHEAMAKAEQRARRAVNPAMRENRVARSMADRQAAMTPGVRHPGTEVEEAPSTPQSGYGTRADAIEIEFDDEFENDDPTTVTTDISFPIEVQRGDALADQLGKLNRLLEQHVLTEEEYAIAKSKLLG